MTLPKQSPLLIKPEPPLSHRHQQSLPPSLEVNASDEVQLEGEADGFLGHIIRRRRNSFRAVKCLLSTRFVNYVSIGMNRLLTRRSGTRLSVIEVHNSLASRIATAKPSKGLITIAATVVTRSR